MEPPRLQISTRLRAHMRYPKMAGPTPRMFVLESQYWLDEACMRAAGALGWEVARAPVRMVGAMPREQVAGLIEGLLDFRPDFVLSVNLSGMDERGVFAGLFADLGVPYVTWFVDDPRTILMARTCYASDHAIALTWDAAYAPYLEQCGFAEVHTLPLAADIHLFDGPPAAESPLPPSFVGNSMRYFAEVEWAWLRARPAIARAVEDAFAAGQVTRARFGEGLEAMLGQEAADWTPDERRHAEMACFIEGTRRAREALVRKLAPLGLEARGDEDWAEITGRCGPYINYATDLPGYYRACATNLNSTSIQMPTTVNQRVFDCPAAGGFLLTDAQAVMPELLSPGTESVVYQDLDEAAELLERYRTDADARRQIIENAQRRIRAEHTYAHRLERIASWVRRRFG